MATVRLNWADPNSGLSQEDDVLVYRSLSTIDPDALPAPIATLPADSIEYLDEGAVAGMVNYYAVAARLNGIVRVGIVQSILLEAASSSATADSTLITADSTFYTADAA